MFCFTTAQRSQFCLILGILLASTTIAEETVSFFLQAPEGLIDQPVSRPPNDATALTTWRETVEAVSATLREGKTAELILGVGTYRGRLEITFDEPLPPSAKLIVRGYGQTRTVWKGSRLTTDWRPAGDGAFALDWPSGWPMAPRLDRSEGLEAISLFVQGRAYRQVAGFEDLTPGTFALNAGARQITILSLREDYVSQSLIEVSDTRLTHLLSLRGIPTVELQNIGFYHHAGAALTRPAAVSFQNINDLTIEEITVAFGSGGGIDARAAEGASSSRMNLVSLNDLQQTALTASDWGSLQIASGRIERSAGYGAELSNIGSLSIAGQRIAENQRGGILAENVAYLDARSLFVAGNEGIGVAVEAHETVIIRDAQVLNNQSGLELASDGEISLAFNMIGGHADSLAITGNPASISFTDNIVASYSNGILLKIPPSQYVGSGNLFFNRAEVPFSWGGTATDFDAWQEASGQDWNSFFGDPLFQDPDGYDFSMAPESPFFAKDTWGTEE